MPIRRRRFVRGQPVTGRVSSAPAQPKQPRKPRQPRVPKVKVPRPKGKDLRRALRGIWSTSAAYRIAALAQALQWYDIAVPYVIASGKGQVTPEQQSWLNKAIKSRKLGISTTAEGEKETALRMSVKCYERACAVLKPISIEAVYAKYEKIKARLEQKEDRLQSKFGNVLQVIQKSLQPVGPQGQPLTLVIEPAAEKDYQTATTLDKLVCSPTAVKNLTAVYKHQGLLPLAQKVIPILSRVPSLSADSEGKYMSDPIKWREATMVLFNNLITFAASADAPRRLVRSLNPVPEQKEKVQRAVIAGQPRPTVPRGPRGGGEKTAGRYVPGSAMAILFETMKDQQVYKLADLQKKFAADINSRMNRLVREGATNEAGYSWTVVWDKKAGTAQMTLTAQP